MAYATKYILGFTNDLNEVYEIYFDYLDFIGISTPIIGAVNALTLRSTGGDEDKFYPILGTECLMDIVVGKTSDHGVVTDDSTLTIYDLIAEHDNDIRITVYKDMDYTTFVYQGFVVVEDNSQPFLDPPFTLSIRALDGLGLLKQVDMVDTNGDLYSGLLSVRDWVGNILYKTGQTMNLREYFPFYSAAGNELLSSLSQVYLDAQTWQIGELTTSTDPTVDVFASEANDAYTALEAICKSFRCRIFQQDGVWNLVSLYSYVNPNGYDYSESTGTLTDGVYNMATTTSATGLNYSINVGKDEIIHPVKDDAVLYLKLATKWVKFNYVYDQAQNKICNQGLKFGDPDVAHDGTIASSIEDPTISPPVTFNFKAYDPFCYTLSSGTVVGGGDSPWPVTAATAYGYIREVLDDTDTPENRYLVIQTATIPNKALTTSFLIDVNDSLAISVDYRTHTDIAGGGSVAPTAFFVLLDGDDGNKYGLGWDGFVTGAKWYLLDSNYRLPGLSLAPPLNFYTYQAGDVTTQWQTYSVDRNLTGGLLQVPVSGSCFLALFGLATSTGAVETWYKNIQITIRPYLQGSYTQLKGDYNYSANTSTIKQTLSEDVLISDSPKRYFKGALVDSGHTVIPPTWHRKGVTESARFQQLMERLVYNNVYRIDQKIEGTFRGLTYVDESYNTLPAGFLNNYMFSDHPTPTKRFLLTSFEKDFGTGQGRHVFVELTEDVNDTGFIEPDTYSFKYIFQ